MDGPARMASWARPGRPGKIGSKCSTRCGVGERMAALLQYVFSDQTVAPPTGNQLRLNGVGIAATLLWVRYLTTDGMDAFYIVSTLPVDTLVVVQDKNDHTLANKFSTTAAPVDRGGYIEI